MRESRSITLAVVSAKNDFANQIVLRLARDADPSGNRTLGVISKPDTLVPGSVSEASFVSLAKNQDVEFRLGWHVLMNMDSKKGQWSLSERNIQEWKFFGQGIWEDLPRSLVGVDSLRTRLSSLLLGQIANELPSLINEINLKISSCRSQLQRFGDPRATLDEQRSYLLHISQAFVGVAPLPLLPLDLVILMRGTVRLKFLLSLSGLLPFRVCFELGEIVDIGLVELLGHAHEVLEDIGCRPTHRLPGLHLTSTIIA